MKLDPQPHDLVTLVEELRDFFHPQCDQAGIMLRTQLPETPITLPVDAGLIKQAILNLMINATEAIRSAAPEDETAPGAPNRRGELMLRVDADDSDTLVSDEVEVTGTSYAASTATITVPSGWTLDARRSLTIQGKCTNPNTISLQGDGFIRCYVSDT